MALLLAVTVISLLVAVTLEFNKNMRQELVGSATVKENNQLGAIVKSGYNLAEAVLLQDLKDNLFDSEHDRWAKLGESSLTKIFYRGSLDLGITDLAGRLQLNSFSNPDTTSLGDTIGESTRDILTQLLLSGEFGDLGAEEVNLIVDAITDWVDEDEKEKGIEDTESSYYLSLNPSYSCKNGPFEHIEELLLVRGITKELFFGDGEYKGLRDFVTVHGDDGKINLNSIPSELLMAMNSDVTDELAQKMVAFREDESNAPLLADVNWYTNIPLWPEDVQFDAKMITSQSKFFSIAAKAKYGEIEKSLYAVVHRESSEKIGMVSRKVE